MFFSIISSQDLSEPKWSGLFWIQTEPLRSILFYFFILIFIFIFNFFYFYISAEVIWFILNSDGAFAQYFCQTSFRGQELQAESDTTCVIISMLTTWYVDIISLQAINPKS